MRQKILNCIAVSYILITTIAFTYAMLGLSPSPKGQPIIFYSYGMMAPYQGYETYNQGLRIEGQVKDGTWVQIDTDPYFPFLNGEATIRSYIYSYLLKIDPELRRKSLERMATHMQRLERKKGNVYHHVRLYWESWPMSSEGFHARREQEILKRTLIAEI